MGPFSKNTYKETPGTGLGNLETPGGAPTKEELAANAPRTKKLIDAGAKNEAEYQEKLAAASKEYDNMEVTTAEKGWEELDEKIKNSKNPGFPENE